MLAVLIYFAAIVAANLSVAVFGPASTGVNAFLLIGLDLALRDRLHDAWAGRWLFPRMLALIIGAGSLSWLLNPAAAVIALASAVAFCASSLVDALVYHWARRKSPVVRRQSSNVAGAAVDSAVFPLLAFGVFLPEIVAMQFAAKVAGGAFWSCVIAWAGARFSSSNLKETHAA